MYYTKNYKLRKPWQDEYYNVDDFNYNAAVIDNVLGAIPQATYNMGFKAIEFIPGVLPGDFGADVEGGLCYNLVPAKVDRLGGVKIGDGVTVEEDGTLNLDVIEITAEDIRELFGSPSFAAAAAEAVMTADRRAQLTNYMGMAEEGKYYEILPATRERLGGVKIGEGVKTDDEGVLSLDLTEITKEKIRGLFL